MESSSSPDDPFAVPLRNSTTLPPFGPPEVLSAGVPMETVAVLEFPLLSLQVEMLPLEVESVAKSALISDASNQISRPLISVGLGGSGRIVPVPILMVFPLRETEVPVALVITPFPATGSLVEEVVKLLEVDAQTPSGAPLLNALAR